MYICVCMNMKSWSFLFIPIVTFLVDSEQIPGPRIASFLYRVVQKNKYLFWWCELCHACGICFETTLSPNKSKGRVCIFHNKKHRGIFRVQEHECVVRPFMRTDRYCELSLFRASSGEVNIHIIQMGIVREFIRVRGSRNQFLFRHG